MRPTGPELTMALSVAVVDDHTMVAELLAQAVEAQPDLRVVGTARSVSEAHALVDRTDPDVVLMDVRLGDGDGVATVAELRSRRPHLRAVILTAHVTQGLADRAVQAGASALLPKDGDLDSLLRAIRSDADDFSIHPRLLRQLGLRRTQPPVVLTAREQEVLRLLATGMDARRIAHELDVTLQTCRSHVKAILAKLDAHSQLEAVASAMRQGLIDGGSEE